MKIFLDSIGCRLNQSEIEKIALQFRRSGHEIVAKANQADLIVVNTCAVTAAASSDSRQHIRQASRQSHARIVATGCWATIEPQIAIELPSVTKVVKNDEKDQLVEDILCSSEEAQCNINLARIPLPGQHRRTRSFIKVQDGCDHNCTYCITRIARGKSRSQPIEEILSDIQSASMGGVKEIVLSGTQLGSWGKNFGSPINLTNLINEIFIRTDIPRVRLSSIEPWDIEEDFFKLFQNSRFCHHFHIPFQSGCVETLRKMGRKGTPEEYRRLINQIRMAAPDCAITTDIMVGFPGETDFEFQQSLDFVQAQRFAGGHVFSFSARPGTPAMHLPDPVSAPIKKIRSIQMRDIFSKSACAYRTKFLGEEREVLWEKSTLLEDKKWMLEGLTDNYIRVNTKNGQDRWNQLSMVKIMDIDYPIVSGDIIE